VSGPSDAGCRGEPLMARAAEAIKRRPELETQIRVALRRLTASIERGDDPDGLSPEVQGVVELIARAGVPTPPIGRAHSAGANAPCVVEGS
jgi:hypothetical protein